MQKQYIIRKLVMARSVAEAIRLERKAPVEEAWLDEEWKKAQPNGGEIGFNTKRRSKKQS